MMERFTVLVQDGVSFVDISKQVERFDKDDVVVALETDQALWIGFRKPFSYFYLEFSVLNTVANALTVEYYDMNDDALKSVEELRDETLGFTRSGFIMFDRPEDDTSSTLWEQTTVNGLEMYWLKITNSANHSAGTTIKGLNILFSNDQDLILERSNIVGKHATEEPTGTWVIKHQAARDEITQRLRVQGRKKIVGDLPLVPNRFKDITPFDILNLDQVRQASKWLTLSKIFLHELSDNADDKWWMLGKDFEKKFEEAFDLFYLSLDTDDDGEEDEVENKTDVKMINIVRH